MIRSDVWAVMALVAQQTQRLRIGTGVAVPGLRLAPVAANGIATINRLAPGRCFIGLGTGNTAMRMLGHPPPLRRLQNLKSISGWSARFYAVRKLTSPWMG